MTGSFIYSKKSFKCQPLPHTHTHTLFIVLVFIIPFTAPKYFKPWPFLFLYYMDILQVQKLQNHSRMEVYSNLKDSCSMSQLPHAVYLNMWLVTIAWRFKDLRSIWSNTLFASGQLGKQGLGAVAHSTTLFRGILPLCMRGSFQTSVLTRIHRVVLY